MSFDTIAILAPMAEKKTSLGLIGLGTMGRNLALNAADNGYGVAAYDQDAEARQHMRRDAGTGIEVVDVLNAVTAKLPAPRAILMLVPAGEAVDELLITLTGELGNGDIVIDGGNSRYQDTNRRAEAARAANLRYLGLGISGGEVGARLGPSLMAGGDVSAYNDLEPLLTSIAAKVDDQPCAAYLGPDGAGHFVKTLHNGIEYADMQLIAETVYLLRHLGGLDTHSTAEVFRRWNQGPLESYLTDITAAVLRAEDGESGLPLLDIIHDRAGEKGTGRWAAIAALELGVAAPSLAEAAFARALSGLPRPVTFGETPSAPEAGYGGGLERDLEQALLASRICSYVQGFQVLAAASQAYAWRLPLATIAEIWRGGCIIRARVLEDLRLALELAPDGDLLSAEPLVPHLAAGLGPLRRVVSTAQTSQLPVPGYASALAYLDGRASKRLWTDVIQAQRDYFGRHGFERVDRPGISHHDWKASGGGTTMTGNE